MPTEEKTKEEKNIKDSKETTQVKPAKVDSTQRQGNQGS